MNESATATDGSERSTGDGGLVRAIGTFGLAAAIVNITVGGGIFRLPANVAESLGSAGPIAYLVCAVAFGLIVLCIADAGSRVSLTGGPYAYVEVAFGPFFGFMSGVLLWLLGAFAVAANSTVFAAAIGALIPVFSGRTGNALFLVLIFGLLAILNIRGVRQGTRFNNVATIAKLLPLVLLAVLGLFAIRAENLRWEVMPPAATVARTSLFLVFAFSGVETALVPSGEVRNTSRTVPRAIFLAMLGITLLYALLQVVSQGVLGPALATAKATPLADAAGRALGDWARVMLLVGASISLFGYMGGMTLAVPRALYAFARDGFLPSPLARVHDRYRTPYVAILVQAVIVCALAVSSTFEKLAILANLSVLLLYLGCCAAAWELRRRGVAADGAPFRVPFPSVLPWAACLLIGWMLLQIRPDEWLAMGICLAAAIGIFLLTAGHRRRRSASTTGVAAPVPR
jgi:amino acid transporter